MFVFELTPLSINLLLKLCLSAPANIENVTKLVVRTIVFSTFTYMNRHKVTRQSKATVNKMFKSTTLFLENSFISPIGFRFKFLLNLLKFLFAVNATVA